MRLPRTSLLARITDADAPGFVLMEAPTGFGKSWLLRKAAPPGALRLRGELGPITHASFDPDTVVIIDDAHLLNVDDVGRLVEHVEDAPQAIRLIVAGRILPDAIHDVAHLVDGLILDFSALAVTAHEIVEVAPGYDEADATQLVEVADGCVRIVSAAIDQARMETNGDAVGIAARILRAGSAASLQQLDANDAGLVNLLARAPGIDQGLLIKLGGPGFLDRALAAGVPLRRQLAGGVDVVGESAYRSTNVEPSVAARLATALIDRGRAVEAIGLLLDAGAHDRAARTLTQLPESVARGIEPRLMLGMLARLGTLTEREPGLLLLRAEASAVIGRIDRTGADIELAVLMAENADPPLRRRVAVEAAEWLLAQGKREEAIKSAEQAIRELGPGEDRTYARAHVVLANAASSSDNRADLQRAAEWYRIAAIAWEGCGEYVKARYTRCDLATAVLAPLGRFDEALAQLSTILGVADLTDAERSWMLMNEGFVLFNANRLESADSRFTRVADLGYVQDNPRMIAAAAWGHALVSARRDDRAATIRWIATAENTALGSDDDLLGVPFHCDMAIELGALGELDLAERHLAIAKERHPLFPDQVDYVDFILATRRGEVRDVQAQLRATFPMEWWRVLLVSALASARAGDTAQGNALLADAERELVSLGFSDFRSLGERRTYDELLSLIKRTPMTDVEVDQDEDADAVPVAGRVPATPVTGRRLRVIGGAMTLESGTDSNELPPGNPQRLVGVVVAHGGFASFDQLSEAIWPGDDVEASRARLRNVLLRLRRGAGNVVVRAGSGVRLAPDVHCDLYEFERLATDALGSARTDPDLAGHLATSAASLADGVVFGDFEYEEWAIEARRSVEHRLISLLDLLSVQAEDSGNLQLAQSMAERALRLDRYSDSRYVRLAELLTMQGRSAAAVAVLEDAAEVAREAGVAIPENVRNRRNEIMRRASTS